MEYQYAPREIRDLPFNLRRSQLYPVNYPTFAQAVEAQVNDVARPVGYFPKKMAFTRYKNGPAAKEAGSSAVSAYQASLIFPERVDALVGPIEAGKGIFTTSQASEHFTRLPQARDNLRINAFPLAKGLSDRPQVMGPELAEYARLQTDPASGTFDDQWLVAAVPPIEEPIAWDSTPLGRLGLGHAGRRGIMRRLKGTSGSGGSSLAWAWTAASIAGTAIGAYHGYKRHDSGWAAVGWALLGGAFPVITVPVAFAQGIGKRA